MTTLPFVPAPITYGCLHCALAAASVRARSLGFWNEARPHLPTISSARIVAGISGTGAGSGDGDDEKEGRLMLLHAPRKTAKAEAIPRLAAVRALGEPTIFSPKQIRGSHFFRRKVREQFLNRCFSQAQKPCRSNDVLKHPIPASPRL